MSRGLNKVHLIGNVGQDPEIKTTSSNMTIATVSLATSTVRKDRDGNTQEMTEWHRLKFFGKVAEIVETYVSKGTQIYVEGRIHYDKYDKNGETRYITEIICDEMQLLGGKGEQRETRNAPQRQAPQKAPDPTPDNGEEFADDDIPF